MKKKIFKNKNFLSVIKFLDKFNIKSFETKSKTDLYIKFFELDKLLKKIPEDKKEIKISEVLRTVTESYIQPFKPDIPDLCRLHWIILSRKSLNVLEFGSGHSTIFMADAHYILDFFFKELEFSRNKKNFHTYTVEENKYYAQITKKRIPSYLEKFITISTSKIKTVYYENRFASKYENLPNISPDFIYLDAPSLYFSKKKFEGFTFARKHRLPMSADILFIEYFLEPGTIVIVDGRTANARFLKDHFKKKWKYFHYPKGDLHYFESTEKPLGQLNNRKLKFCLGSKYKNYEKK